MNDRKSGRAEKAEEPRSGRAEEQKNGKGANRKKLEIGGATVVDKKNSVFLPINHSTFGQPASFIVSIFKPFRPSVPRLFGSSALPIFRSSALRPFRSSALRLFRSSALPIFLLFPLFLLLLLLPISTFASGSNDIASILKSQDACVLLTPGGRELVAVHADTPLIPASTLKVFTSLVGFYYLGTDYRFPTEIYLDDDGDLTVKGFGDPLLISEVLKQLASKIRRHLPEGKTAIRDMILDDSYFTSPLTIPGVSDSDQPYDAANGALCANFNTIAFSKRADGTYVSGEEQTPLLPSVLGRVRKSGLKEGRIPLLHNRGETTGYTGQLLAHFLKENGVGMTGRFRFATVDTTRDHLLLTFESPFRLSQAVSKLLEFSNNFMANQILIAAGAKVYGPPGTLEKGVRAAKAFAENELHIHDLNITEGAGISRENRITPRTMMTVLKAFEPHRDLLRQTDHSYYKTGTLKGIATRVGYLLDDEGNEYPFVVMLNASDLKMGRVMEELEQQVP